jgi:hypothetical protein
VTSTSRAHDPSVVASSPERDEDFQRRVARSAQEAAAGRFLHDIQGKIADEPGALSLAIIYLSDDRDHAQVLDAVARAAAVLDMEVAELGPQVRGSLWQPIMQANPSLQMDPRRALGETGGEEPPPSDPVTSGLPDFTGVPLDRITVSMVNAVVGKVVPPPR